MNTHIKQASLAFVAVVSAVAFTTAPAFAAEKATKASGSSSVAAKVAACEKARKPLSVFDAEVKQYSKNYFAMPSAEDLAKYYKKTNVKGLGDKGKDSVVYVTNGPVPVFVKGKLVGDTEAEAKLRKKRTNYALVLQRHEGAYAKAASKAGMTDKASMKTYKEAIDTLRADLESYVNISKIMADNWTLAGADCKTAEGQAKVKALTKERKDNFTILRSNLSDVKKESGAASRAYGDVAKDYKAKPKATTTAEKVTGGVEAR